MNRKLSFYSSLRGIETSRLSPVDPRDIPYNGLSGTIGEIPPEKGYLFSVKVNKGTRK